MMKQLFLAVLVIAAMASCSKNETTDLITQKGINFGVVNGNSVESRAAANVTDATALGVYAFSSGSAYDGITNLKLAKAGSAWGLPSVHYYPATDSEVSFWAYAPHNNTKLSNTSCSATTGPAFTLTLINTDKDVDIMATQTVKTGKKTASSAIVFALERVLSQIKFQAYTADATNFQSKITSITVKAKGASAYANSAWGAASGNDITWTAFTGTQTITAASASTITGASSLNLIPASDQAAVITVVVDIYNSDGSIKLASNVTSTYTVPTQSKWAQGNAYTYIIKINPTSSVSAISFGTPTVEGWSATTGSDINVPTP